MLSAKWILAEILMDHRGLIISDHFVSFVKPEMFEFAVLVYHWWCLCVFSVIAATSEVKLCIIGRLGF